VQGSSFSTHVLQSASLAFVFLVIIQEIIINLTCSSCRRRDGGRRLEHLGDKQPGTGTVDIWVDIADVLARRGHEDEQLVLRPGQANLVERIIYCSTDSAIAAQNRDNMFSFN
jgi:hypothetical protein